MGKVMEVYTAIKKRRAIRQFGQKQISREVLSKIANAGRLAPSGLNLQPLKFLVIDDLKLSKKAFSIMKWAGYLKGWIPPENKRARAYIFIIVDPLIKNKYYEYDVGLAASNIMIAATGFGLGSCPMAVPNSQEAAQTFGTPKRYLFTLAVALGYPGEKSEEEVMKDSVEYYHNNKGRLRVPKRKIHDVIFFNSPPRN